MLAVIAGHEPAHGRQFLIQSILLELIIVDDMSSGRGFKTRCKPCALRKVAHVGEKIA